MDLRQASGVPLPANDLPAGTVSVRVVRGSFANNVAKQPVTFRVNGADRPMTTDDAGRAQVTGLATGAVVVISTALDGQRLQSQEITIGATGIRVVLVGEAPAGAPVPAAPVTSGSVAIGGDSRIVVDFADERLNVYYVVHVVNPAAGAVDVGGPLVFELPQGARGATVMEGSSPNASANGPRVTVTGPFQPGTTEVNIAFELPFSGDSAELVQTWPVDAGPMTVFAVKTGAMDIDSPQITGKQNTSQQGQTLVAGMTSAVAKGTTFTATVTGLPYAPLWPRNLAFLAAGVILIIGLWSAFGAAPNRQAA